MLPVERIPTSELILEAFLIEPQDLVPSRVRVISSVPNVSGIVPVAVAGKQPAFVSDKMNDCGTSHELAVAVGSTSPIGLPPSRLLVIPGNQHWLKKQACC